MKFNLSLENIKYIKILYKDSKGEPNFIKAAIKEINTRELIACAKFDESLQINTPQEITLSIVCTDGLYRTKTVLKSFEEDEPYIFLFLETPQGLEYQQNREYFRITAEYNCIYTVVTSSGEQEFQLKTYDISANGISFIIPEHIISKDDTKLVIFIGNKPIETIVRYIRSEKFDDGYKLSFTYSKINENDRDYIVQTCIKKQLEERRNSIR